MDMAEKISITLPSEMVNVIKQHVQSGSFSSTSEVLRTAMRSWLRQEEEHEERLKAIKTRLQTSLDDPRLPVPADEAFTTIRERLAEKFTAK